MKRLVFTLALWLILLAPSILKAQGVAMLDSIHFSLGNHLSMEVISQDFYAFDKWGSMDEFYKHFLTDLNQISGEVNAERSSNNFQYTREGDYRKLSVNDQRSVENEVSFDEERGVIYFQVAIFQLGEQDKIVFKSPNLEGFTEIGTLNLDELINTAREEEFPEGRGKNNHAASKYFVENGMIATDKTQFNGKPTDTLELGLGIGVGTVRSTITPVAELKAMANLRRKGTDRLQFGVSYEAYFSFHPNETEGDIGIGTSSFLNLIFGQSGRILSTGQRQMVGIKLGVTPNWDDRFFNGPACKAVLYYELGNRFILEPGFIFEDNFKKAFPALKLGVRM